MTTLSKNQSRMFRTIVLMGSGLALGCGGKAGEDGSASAGGSGTGAAGGPSGTLGGASAGGTVSSGGSNGGTLNIGPSGGAIGVGSSGGSSSIGGSSGGAISIGGAMSVGGASPGGAPAVGGSGGTPACPPAEWTCSGPTQCDYDTGWQPNDCKCDASRPKTPADCKAGQVFVCLGTGSSSANQRQGFECQCVPSGAGCSAECAAAYPNLQYGDISCDEQTDPNTVLCGCAIVLLR
jgi:hypothetical protein